MSLDRVDHLSVPGGIRRTGPSKARVAAGTRWAHHPLERAQYTFKGLLEITDRLSGPSTIERGRNAVLTGVESVGSSFKGGTIEKHDASREEQRRCCGDRDLKRPPVARGDEPARRSFHRLTCCSESTAEPTLKANRTLGTVGWTAAASAGQLLLVVPTSRWWKKGSLRSTSSWQRWALISSITLLVVGSCSSTGCASGFVRRGSRSATRSSSARSSRSRRAPSPRRGSFCRRIWPSAEPHPQAVAARSALLEGVGR